MPFFLETLDRTRRTSSPRGLTENLERDVPTPSSTIVANGTERSSMTARVNVNGIGSSTPGRSMSRLTSVPGLPLSRLAAWSVSQSSADAPSTSTIRSPARIPARNAGPRGAA